MHAHRFDGISRLLAERRLSRRAALATGGAGLAAGALAAAGVGRAVAQDEATPTTSDGGAEGTAKKIEFLFVQSFQSGSLTPKAGADGTYTLKLEQGLGQTIYFSDRPERIVGATPTAQFLEGLGFAVDNPPNAALVVNDGNGETDVAVLELTNPIFDPASPGITYDVTVLAEWRKELEVDFHEAPGDLGSLPATFGPASLFIDDCPNSDIDCVLFNPDADSSSIVGGWRNQPLCWNYQLCQPCEPYGHNFPSFCAAWDYWKQKCYDNWGAKCGAKGYECTPAWGWTEPWCGR